jgi:hypothetical protein
MKSRSRGLRWLWIAGLLVFSVGASAQTTCEETCVEEGLAYIQAHCETVTGAALTACLETAADLVQECLITNGCTTPPAP